MTVRVVRAVITTLATSERGVVVKLHLSDGVLPFAGQELGLGLAV
jgi:hypothetical protein